MRDDKKAREMGQEPAIRNAPDYQENGKSIEPQMRAHEITFDCKGKNVNIRLR